MDEQISRKDFASFLSILLERKVSNAEWEYYMVEHYSDKGLEKVRANIVRLRFEAGFPQVFPSNYEDREKINSWIEELKQE